MLMANSVEGRFPFLDHRLIEFANRLQPNAQDARAARETPAQGNHARPPAGIHPQALQTTLSRARCRRVFRGERARATSPSCCSESRVRDYGYFDAEKVTRLTAKLRKSQVPSARDNMAFVGMLSTQLWHAQFVAGETR